MKSTYTQLLKAFNYAYYAGDKNLRQISFATTIPEQLNHSSVFNEIVKLDVEAARIQASIQKINIAETNQLAGSINLGLTEMLKNKQTIAYQPTYASQTAPLLKKNQDEQLQKEEIESRLKKYIYELQQAIPSILKLPKQEALTKIEELKQKVKTLVNDMNLLDRKARDTRKQLESNFQGMRALLPSLNVSTPKTSESPPQPE